MEDGRVQEWYGRQVYACEQDESGRDARCKCAASRIILW